MAMPAQESLSAAAPLLKFVTLLLAAGSVSGYLAQRLRIPDVVLYLLAGVLLGPQVLGIADLPAGSVLNQAILIFGASYILFEGGAEVRLAVLSRIWLGLTLLATLGVLVTAAVTAVAAHWLLGLDPLLALLLGAVIASTDPATLVPVFKQVRVRERLAQMVVSESAFNDAVGAILTFTLLAMVSGTDSFSLQGALLDLVRQAGLGIAAGVGLGFAAALLMGHARYGFLRDYAPLVTLMAVAGAYLGAENLQASGFMAVFTAGIIVGNRERFGFGLDERDTRRLHEYIGITSLVMRMLIFILLGMHVDFQAVGAHLGGSLAVVAVFMFVARPLVVFLCAAPDRRARWSLKELLFMCWTRETGVIPGALAGMLLAMGAPEAGTIAAVTFVAILATLLLQATTTRWLAARLELLERN
ncbi:MAG TPA: sodium:proton antiporter [Gammaproteobacteria bacterium]|jgi:cell volume regulation protein A|nr:sodium:proton antiporter [Gammaproteobacteria bacterium]